MDDTKSKWNNRKARNPHNKELVTKEMRVKDHNIVRVGLHCLVKVSQSYPTLCNPWTAALQAPLSMGFSRQEYWSGLPCPSPEDLPNPGIELRSPALQADSLLSELPALHQDHIKNNNEKYASVLMTSKVSSGIGFDGCTKIFYLDSCYFIIFLM